MVRVGVTLSRLFSQFMCCQYWDLSCGSFKCIFSHVMVLLSLRVWVRLCRPSPCSVTWSITGTFQGPTWCWSLNLRCATGWMSSSAGCRRSVPSASLVAGTKGWAVCISPNEASGFTPFPFSSHCQAFLWDFKKSSPGFGELLHVQFFFSWRLLALVVCQVKSKFVESVNLFSWSLDGWHGDIVASRIGDLAPCLWSLHILPASLWGFLRVLCSPLSPKAC